MIAWRDGWIVGDVSMQRVNGRLTLVEQGALFDTGAYGEQQWQRSESNESDCSASTQAA